MPEDNQLERALNGEDLPKPADQHAHHRATFPPLDKIPPQAHMALEEFLGLRRRLAQGKRNLSAARSALSAAIELDREHLREHVRGGGISATFEHPHVKKVKELIVSSTEDVDILNDLLRSQYGVLVRVLQDVANEGGKTAQADIDTSQAAYLEAIDSMEQARRRYLDAVGLHYFWAHLHNGSAFATAGCGDQIVMRRGPITKVDSSTISLLRLDAQAHTRIDALNEPRSCW